MKTATKTPTRPSARDDKEFLSAMEAFSIATSRFNKAPEKGKEFRTASYAVESAQAALCDAADALQACPASAPATSDRTDDPAMQIYLDGIRDVTKRYVATLPSSPSCELPILISKVQALAIATESLHRVPEDSGKRHRRAMKAVDKAEKALYGTVDHLRAAAREFGWYDAQRGEKPASPAPLDPSGSSDTIIRSIEDLGDGMASA
jgi:hypothetical protein